MVFGGAMCCLFIAARNDRESMINNLSKLGLHVLILTELDDSVSVLFATYAWESSYKFSRRVLVMIGCCNGAWDVSCRFFELEEHDSRHADVGLVEEVEREVE